MKTLHVAAIGGLLSLSVLAGCSKSEPEQPPMTENATVEEVTPAPEPTLAPVETPEAARTNVAITPPPAEKIAPDVQMGDDADATGMTARVTRDDDGGATPANDQPIQ